VSRPPVEADPLLTSAEVAVLFGVDRRTVARWAREGVLPAAPTPGRHLRFHEADVRALLKGRQAAGASS
jgi:excisionase family DNA binding protein